MTIPSRPIRVLQLSTSDWGGAGIAAKRLHEALLSQNVESHFAFIPRRGEVVEGTAHSTPIRRHPTALLRSRVVRSIDSWGTKQPSLLFTPLSTTSVPDDLITQFSPDIIHVHNWFNLANPEWLLSHAYSGRPMVITLHDERSYTGGCHHADGCELFESRCYPCPQSKLWARPYARKSKRVLADLAQMESVRFVAPSRWIERRFLSSLTGEGVPAGISHIPNAIPDEFFGRETARLEGPIRFMWHANKGTNLVLKALEELGKELPRKAMTICYTGELPGDVPFGAPLPCLRTEAERADALHSCHGAISVARLDNAPNAVAEAMAAQLPVIVGRTGGAMEPVEKSGGGLIVSVADPSELESAIRRLMRDEILRREMGELAREWALKNVTSEVVATKHLELYVDSLR